MYVALEPFIKESDENGRREARKVVQLFLNVAELSIRCMAELRCDVVSCKFCLKSQVGKYATRTPSGVVNHVI